MAIINNTKKFIFVHVPKAAGTSTTNILSKYTTYLDLEIGGTSFGEEIQDAYIKRFSLAKHTPASGIRDVLGREAWNDIFKFSIVRNPYDRVISTYKFLKAWEDTPAKCKEELAKFKDINEYILSDLWEESDGPDSIFKPQHFWLTDTNDSNKVIVDFVGKVESLDKDTAYIQSRIERREIEPVVTPQLNKIEGNLELSAQSIAKINRVYKRDFTLWHYDQR